MFGKIMETAGNMLAVMTGTLDATIISAQSHGESFTNLAAPPNHSAYVQVMIFGSWTVLDASKRRLGGNPPLIQFSQHPSISKNGWLAPDSERRIYEEKKIGIAFI
jgi:hypothetical protein